MTPMTIMAALAEVTAFWSPAVVGRVDDQLVTVGKIKGEVLWQDRADEDELFHVIDGDKEIQFEDRGEAARLSTGDIFVVPKGVVHQPVAEAEAAVSMWATRRS